MSSNHAYDDPDKTNAYDLDTELNTEGYSDCAPVSAGTRSKAERREETVAPPGPASFKAEFRSRARSSSVASERRSRRRASFDANRNTTAESDSEQEEKGSSTVIVSDDTDADHDEEFHSPLGSREPSLKRKANDKEPSEATSRKQGKQQTTGLYVGRREAREALNRAMREAAELEREETLRKMTKGQLFEKYERSVDQYTEQLENAQTADVAHRNRENMAEVLRVARTSNNLSGRFVKILKQAAACSLAATEVLRTRADSSESNEGDATWQLKAMRRELADVKLEARTAREESEALRRELAEAKAQLERIGGRKRVIKDDDYSPPRSSVAAQPCEVNPEEIPMADPITEDPPMEIDEAEAEPLRAPVYCDKRRKQEILPPRKEWPVVAMPALRGKVKIVDDRMLEGHKVKVRVRHEPTARESGKKDAQVEARTLMERITPLLERWLRENLLSLGLPNPPTEGSKNLPKKGKGKKGAPDTVPPAKAREAAPPHPPVARQERTTKPLPGDDEGVRAPVEKWTEVVKKRPRKSATTGTQPNPGQEKKGPPNKAQDRSGKPTSKGTGQKQGGQGKVAAKRRPPRSAAVTLTCPPNMYAEAMKTARERINLKELGIESLKPRRAVTGALVLEVPGPNGAERAQALKEQMAEALKAMEGVKVARPVKMADLRVKDLEEDSLTPDEIKKALASLGGCKESEIKTGETKRAPNGLGTLWVQCPLAAANRIAATGRVGFGWTTSRVEALEPRRLQCFRCLQRGHVQGVCPSPVGRSDLCYRCSEPGHTAKACTKRPHCILCHEKGLASSHRIGGMACKAPKKPVRTGGEPTRSTVGNKHHTEGNKPPTDSAMEVVEEEVQPAVRGGSLCNASEGTPVPVRLDVQTNEEEPMETETTPAPSQPPLEKRPTREKKGVEGPNKASPSPPR